MADEPKPPTTIRSIVTGAIAVAVIGALVVRWTYDDRPSVYPVAGILTDQGTPLAYVDLTLTPVGGGKIAFATTDPDGKFELKFVDGRMGALPGKHDVEIAVAVGGGSGPEIKVAPGGMLRPKIYRTQFTVKTDGENQMTIDLSTLRSKRKAKRGKKKAKKTDVSPKDSTNEKGSSSTSDVKENGPKSKAPAATPDQKKAAESAKDSSPKRPEKK